MDIDIYKKDLSEKLGSTAFNDFAGMNIHALIRARQSSVFSKIKIIFRFEILICAAEIIDSAINLFNASDKWSIFYYMLQLAISLIFIFIFFKLIAVLNSPSVKSQPVKESSVTVLALMQKFYKRYLQFVLIYVFLNGTVNILAVLIENTGFEADKTIASLMNKIQNPVYRYVYLFAHQIILGLLVFLICRWIIRLLYGRRIRELKTLVQEFDNP